MRERPRQSVPKVGPKDGGEPSVCSGGDFRPPLLTTAHLFGLYSTLSSFQKTASRLLLSVRLPSGPLSVVEACSGIRSLLSLTFLSLVYGCFFEKRSLARVLLFAATIPIAILANAGRVTITGVLSQFNPDLAKGFFHESTGWVIFMLALGILLLFHQVMLASIKYFGKRTA